jgi:hypothetical protein
VGVARAALVALAACGGGRPPEPAPVVASSAPAPTAVDAAPAECREPDPVRTKAHVIALAGRAFHCPESDIHEYNAMTLQLCGHGFLERYTMLVCGQCVSYGWADATGWSVIDTHPLPAGPDATCD